MSCRNCTRHTNLIMQNPDIWFLCASHFFHSTSWIKRSIFSYFSKIKTYARVKTETVNKHLIKFKTFSTKKKPLHSFDNKNKKERTRTFRRQGRLLGKSPGPDWENGLSGGGKSVFEVASPKK